MRSVLLLMLLLPALAWAQARTQTPPEALPPPDIDDPAVVETAPEAAPAGVETPALPPAELSPRDARRPSAASAPTVAIRTGENGDLVEEYRVNGMLYMVKVTPRKGGPSYTLRDSNGDGRLDSRDSSAPVAPVYFTLYEWN